jgi:2-polyprenyl-3-methyl-5-hydroxy-6-metoxy-1,4-benzoquinol methylase
MKYQHSQKFSKIPIQNVETYWNRRPCNLRHSKQEVGTKKYFEEVSSRKFFVEPHLVDFASFPSMKGKKVLEIGCGLGTCAINFALAGAEVTAVDLSQKSIDIAEKNAASMGVKDRIQFFQGNAEQLSTFLPDEQYDLIFSFGVIHHTPHPDVIVKEARKFLAPDGEFKIMVYYRYSWKVLWILARFGRFKFWKLSHLIARYSEAQTGCPVTYAYSKKGAKKLFETRGFQVKSIGVDHIFPYRIRDYARYQYVKVWYFRFLPKMIFRFLEKKLGWHLCLNAKLSTFEMESV